MPIPDSKSTAPMMENLRPRQGVVPLVFVLVLELVLVVVVVAAAALAALAALAACHSAVMVLWFCWPEWIYCCVRNQQPTGKPNPKKHDETTVKAQYSHGTQEPKKTRNHKQPAGFRSLHFVALSILRVWASHVHAICRYIWVCISRSHTICSSFCFCSVFCGGFMARQGDTRVKRSASSKKNEDICIVWACLSIVSLFLAFYRQCFLHNTCGSPYFGIWAKAFVFALVAWCSRWSFLACFLVCFKCIPWKSLYVRYLRRLTVETFHRRCSCPHMAFGHLFFSGYCSDWRFDSLSLEFLLLGLWHFSCILKFET